MANKLADPDQQIPEYVKGYVTNPRETLTCELKPWMNPSAQEVHQVTLVKTCLALRNINGGVLLVGLSNDGNTQALAEGYDPDAIFTQDSVQAAISAFSAEPFGVDVHHVLLAEPAGARVVAIVVPEGVTTPVICKKDLRDAEPSLRKGVIYVRTLRTNGTVSSAPVSQQDLNQIVKACFDNRVADIGKFLREHLTTENIDVLRAAIAPQQAEPEEEDEQDLDEFAAASAEAFITPPTK